MYLVLLPVLLSLFFSQSAIAAIDVDQVPIAIRDAVAPNIVLLADDSGSMSWNFMPDSLSQCYGTPSDPTTNLNGNGSLFCRSSAINKIFYNPDVIYVPPVNAAGTSLGDADVTAAWYDGFYLDAAGNHKSATRNLINADFYVFDVINCDATDSRDYSKIACFTRNLVSALDTDDQTNYANWASYYSTRLNAAKSGLSHAFISLNSSYRLGWGRINNYSSNVLGAPAALESGVSPFLNSKANFYSWLFSLNANGGTPLRQALDAAGRYFSSIYPYQEIPGQASSGTLSCRQNFTVLMTDGYWNGYVPNSSPAGGLNSDGLPGKKYVSEAGVQFQYQPVAPFSDSLSETLADIAMHYWKNDLLTGMVNDVPVSELDPAFWQHMVTIGIGLGVSGNVSATDAFSAIDTGNSIVWGDPLTSNSSSPAKIDDLLHAAVNSRGAYYSAQNPTQFASGLSSAINSVTSRIYSGTSPAVNSSRVEGGRFVYRSAYFSGDWSGSLSAAPIDVQSGAIANDIWQANFPLWSERSLFTAVKQSNGSLSGGVFAWDSVDSAIQDGMRISSSYTDLEAQSVMNYLSGDQSLEARNGGSFRDRSNSLLGDIVHSSPVYVGPANPNLYSAVDWNGSEKYGTFSQLTNSRTQMVYVGSNDGMLHGFDALTGVEKFAYLPREFLVRDLNPLNKLALPSYQHTYFADGLMSVADVYIGNEWKTILVGSAGRGGNSIFAIDITDPDQFDESKVLWEVTGDDVGSITSAPVIAQTPNGDWVAILGNGYNSVSDEAKLLVINVKTGELQAISTGFDILGQSNGLSGPFVWDSDEVTDQLYDTVYAGDILGNVWKFDLSNLKFVGTSNPSASLVMTARDSSGSIQPITSSIQGSKSSDSELWLFFGTGRFLSSSDLASFTQSSTTSSQTSLISNLTLDDNVGGNGISASAYTNKSFAIASGESSTLIIETALRNINRSDGLYYRLIKNGVLLTDGWLVVPNPPQVEIPLDAGDYVIEFYAQDGSRRSSITFEADLQNVYLNTITAVSSSASQDQTQTWYGINSTLVQPTVDRSLLKERVLTDAGVLNSYSIRTLPEAEVGDMVGMSGWYIDLPATGERMVSPNTLRQGVLLGQTLIPDIDACGSDTDGYILAVDPFTGTRLQYTYFDFSSNGTLDSADKVLDPNDSNSSIDGSGFSVGESLSNPVFAENQLITQTGSGGTEVIEVAGTAASGAVAKRVSWREIRN
jgi:type IV pilus assembly protein PilY1